MYAILKLTNKEYKCRLSTRNLINLEKRLGENPLNVFISVSETELPKLETLLVILHESLQSLEHGITLDDTYDIYDQWIEEGNGFIELISFLMEVYKASGLIKEEKKKSKSKASEVKN